MGTVATAKAGTDFKPVPAGTHPAVCTMVVDMGVQPGGQFKPRHQIYIRWELPNELTTWKVDGVEREGPMVIGRKYTLSLSEKANLRADLEAWRGKTFTQTELDGFDVKSVLGASCMLGVTHKTMPDGKVYANISAVMGIPKGMTKPAAAGSLVYYDIDSPDAQTYDKLPGWLRDAIRDRVPEAAQTVAANGSTGVDTFNDDIPF